MSQSTALIFNYTRSSRYSFNALAGALDNVDGLDNLTVFFVENEKEIGDVIANTRSNFDKVITAFSIFTNSLLHVKSQMDRLSSFKSPDCLFIAGGPHPTGLPLSVLSIGFDIVVYGEGEQTLIDLLTAIGQNSDYKKVPGIIFLDDSGNMKTNPRCQKIILDNFPPFPVKHQRFGHIEITRGCPYGCFFCQTSRIMGKTVRHRSIDVICQYVKIMKNHDRLDFRAITPDALSYGSPDGKILNLDAVENLLYSLKKILAPDGLIYFGSFPSEIRPDHITMLSLKLIKEHAENDYILIGAQSGSDKLLQASNRCHTAGDILCGVERTLQAGLKACVDFIFNLPGETCEDRRLTLDLIKILSRKNVKIHAHWFTPLPQTVYWNKENTAHHDNSLLIEELKRLSVKGIIYGDWQKQIYQAQIIRQFQLKERC